MKRITLNTPKDAGVPTVDIGGGRELNKEEFEKQYAKRSGRTVQYFHDHNQYAYPCDCGEPGCEGWAMMDKDLAKDRKKILGHY